jgi:glycerophosphoryl diester phosphodiesterase
MDPIYIVLTVLASVLVLLFITYLFLVMPRRHRKESDKYRGARFAHRGLHGKGAAENSLTAFKRAVESGVGIELDVRLSSDGELVVFHDDTLDRVTSESGRVNERTLQELKKIKLSDTEDTIPSLYEVFSLVDGKVPLLIEIKEAYGETAVSEKLCEVLPSYTGEYIIESFNPFALATVKKKMPHVIRGILSDSLHKDKDYRTLKFMTLEYLLINVFCRPDFIAYGYKGYKNISLRLCRALGCVTFAWTCKGNDAQKEALSHGFDSVIFEEEE